MNTMLWYWFLLITIACNVQEISAISSLDDETYETFLALLKGEFNASLKQRTTEQKSALVRFWRNRNHVSLKGGKVCYDGKPILRKAAVSEVAAKAFKETKGSGVRKIYYHLKDVCSGMGERDVRGVLGTSRLHQWLNVRFQNKAALKPVCARTVQIRHQMDFVSMESMPESMRNGKVFKYVLSLLDVFSRYHWLIPLEGKKISTIAAALSTIYQEHGPPCVLQHDQGREFDGAVNKLCKKLGIKVIKGRPYHPQSQGKIEWTHRSFKKKMYDLLTMRETGVNWAKCLPEYARTLNQESKVELS